MTSSKGLSRIAPYAISRFLREGLQLSDAAKGTGLVWEGVRNATQKNLRAWFDTNTVDDASKHLSSLIPVIGEPEHLKSASALDDYYDHLPQFTQPFLQSWLNASQRHMDKYKRLLKEGPSVTVHREDINEDMIGANAQYLPLFHVMVIKTGLMLPPFTSAGVPNAIPYGAIGRMLGQELTRAFDPVFVNVTRTGEPMDWYTPNSTSNFASRLMCVHGQVEEITRDALHALNSPQGGFRRHGGNREGPAGVRDAARKERLAGLHAGAGVLCRQLLLVLWIEPVFPLYLQLPGERSTLQLASVQPGAVRGSLSAESFHQDGLPRRLHAVGVPAQRVRVEQRDTKHLDSPLGHPSLERRPPVLVYDVRHRLAAAGASPIDATVVVAFTCIYITTLSLSVLYHTFNCQSKQLYQKLLKYDMVGVDMSLWATVSSGVVMAFDGQPFSRLLYIAIEAILLVGILSKASTDDTGIFCTLGAFGLLPTVL
ncbi:hypothetical protein HPB48_011964 [Haemaphysalis longicornis]|uniref:Peptidase M13 C-terminal domain-containing protein n=1 Tax=Haemaphysalis longicornis TaxID=44386 RepID=A0A9J6GIH9_HAELO|nr:hypothetical protein HPB48_011964 [Haemaphysalis longicornis]